MISVDLLLVLIAGAAIIFFLGSFIRVVPEYERVIIFRLGRKTKAVFNPGGDGNGPGLVLLVPFIDKIRQRISLRTVAIDVPPQDVITRDNVSIKVNAVIFFRVINPEQAFLSVEDYMYATSQLAQTTLRSVLGQMELDDLLSARDKVNQQLQRIIDEHTEPWGVKVSTVEVKQIDLPQDMQRAMSKQAEAERERRAKVINAEGEFQAAAKLARGRRGPHALPGRRAAPLSADDAGDRLRAEHHHVLPAADGPDRPAPQPVSACDSGRQP